MLQEPTTFEEEALQYHATYPSFTICPFNKPDKNESFDTIFQRINKSKSGLFTNATYTIDDRTDKK